MDLAGGPFEPGVAGVGQWSELSLANLLVLPDRRRDALDVTEQLVALHPLATTGAKLAVDILDLVDDVDDM